MGYLVYVSSKDKKISLSGSEYTHLEKYETSSYTADTNTYTTTTSTSTTRASYSTSTQYSSEGGSFSKTYKQNTYNNYRESESTGGYPTTTKTSSSTSRYTFSSNKTETTSMSFGETRYYTWDNSMYSTYTHAAYSYTYVKYSNRVSFEFDTTGTKSYTVYMTTSSGYAQSLTNYRRVGVYITQTYYNNLYSISSSWTGTTYTISTTSRNTTSTSRSTSLKSTETLTVTNTTSYGTFRLKLLTGDDGDRIEYGWTTDSSASEYSPIRAILQNGKTGYIGRHQTETYYIDGQTYTTSNEVDSYTTSISTSTSRTTAGSETRTSSFSSASTTSYTYYRYSYFQGGNISMYSSKYTGNTSINGNTSSKSSTRTVQANAGYMSTIYSFNSYSTRNTTYTGGTHTFANTTIKLNIGGFSGAGTMTSYSSTTTYLVQDAINGYTQRWHSESLIIDTPNGDIEATMTIKTSSVRFYTVQKTTSTSTSQSTTRSISTLTLTSTSSRLTHNFNI